VLTAAALGAFASTVMATSVNVAMPSLVQALDAPFALVQWVVLAYLLATAALLPIVGRLADMLGKRAIFVAGFVIYAVGSVATGAAPGVASLIAFRLVHGVGSAIPTGVGLAIVTDVFPSEERGRAIGINGAVLSAGIVLGPTLGGLLVEIGWRWVFLMGTPVGVLGALLAWRFVPPYPRGEEQRFDLPGAALLTASLTSLSLALTLGQDLGFGAPTVLAFFAGAAAGLPLFLLVERGSPHPIVDLSMFRDLRLSVGLAAGLGTFVSIAGTIFVMPFYLENVLALPPRHVGLLMSVTPILLVILAPIAGTLADRHGERIVTVVGLSTPLGFVLRFVPVGIGMGTFQSPNNSAIMGSAPRGRSGVAGGLLGLTRALGQTSGIAVLGSLWAARVAARAGGAVGSEGSLAPVAAQVGGLHDMMRVVQVLITLALGLCLWDLLRGRGRRRPDGRSSEQAASQGAREDRAS
ncbi:MAG: MFS transporter, partial [Deinococcus-Thermus bacterium]|jgi:EmrB/QacA subfamily drug resistance transporter|nr:MFS transporter [Deinococcota bacterium]